ncbi:MAG: hypothetical protein HQL36_00305 [Alphaproteobacteria bacterium]|nr:hypothetical protein [Alphaproteobacteria bacterium]MBF0249394.1 hypothetical protein [Alphaproteobacteria bacterium]
MISPEVIDKVFALAEAGGGSADVLGGLRQLWPHIHFTHCLEDELCLEKPVREGTVANVYLVNGNNHCAVITDHEPSATGFLIAEL